VPDNMCCQGQREAPCTKAHMIKAVVPAEPRVGAGTWRQRGRGMQSTAAACWRGGSPRARTQGLASARRT